MFKETHSLDSFQKKLLLAIVIPTLAHIIGEKVLLNSELDLAIVRLANTFGYPAYENAKCWTLLVNDLCKQVITTGAIRL
jgi:hypothetical protein